MRAWLGAALAAALAAACGQTPSLPEVRPVAEPPAADVESVVFLIGDAGLARPGRSPVLERLRREVEEWAARLRRDSAVVVLFLGDNAYPEGVHARGTPAYVEDRQHLLAQAAVVAGPQATRFHTPAIFLAGNHDWGKRPAPEGLAQLLHQDTLIDSLRAAGYDVRLMPDPGKPKIAVVDVRRHLRLVLIDTSWWLLASPFPETGAFLAQIRDALRGARGRAVLMASHHPFKSGASHGGLVPFWKTLGVRYLLARSGALLQDLNSIPYRRLVDGMRAVFRETGAPLLYAGGHDHNLQVIERFDPEDPLHMVVSGAASKTGRVGYVEGMVYRGAKAGYMRLETLRDGRVYLFVTAADPQYQACDQTDDAALRECMRQGVAAYETDYAARLK